MLNRSKFPQPRVFVSARTRSSQRTQQWNWIGRSIFSILVAVIMLLAGIASPAFASTPVSAGYRDFSFGTTGVSAPTGEKPESKLWFNDGAWWGSLYHDASRSYHIYRLDLPSQSWVDTGIQLDNRPSTKADTLWDGQHLYVASHIFTTSGQPTTSTSNWGRLYRYSYDSGSKTYSLDSGFPVTVTKGKSETLVLDKDSAGVLWVTYVESGKVMLNHSQGNDAAWGTPFILPIGAAKNLVTDDISSLIAYQGKVGVMWSNQNDKVMYFAVHDDSNPDDQAWKMARAYAPGGSGADDHMNLKQLAADSAGNVFAVTKTSFSNSTQPLILLLVCKGDCSSGSSWASHTVYQKGDHHTRAILLIDTDQRNLYVFSSSPESGGVIYRKSTPIDNIQFASGHGDAFIKSASDLTINDATSTKQNLNRLTGLVVLASDSQTRYYLHNWMDLGGGGGGGGGTPVISSFTPANGPPGTQVTIAGSGFTGASQVAFNGTPAGSFSIDSDSQVRATVPDGASTGKISVTTPGGTGTSATDFTVTTSSGSALTFNPSQDAHVNSSNPNSNYGSNIGLRVKVSSPTYNSYLKFDVIGLNGTVQSAKLRLYVTDPSPVGGSIFRVNNEYLGTATPWVESGLTWNNAPAIGGSPLASLGAVSLDTWVELDVTAAIAGNGTYSFALNSTSTNSAIYSSKEGANPPQLVITTAP